MNDLIQSDNKAELQLEEQSEVFTIPTLREAKMAMNTVLQFFEMTTVGEQKDINNATYFLDRLQNIYFSQMKQTLLTDFFKREPL